jgi:hypothetical protein
MNTSNIKMSKQSKYLTKLLIGVFAVQIHDKHTLKIFSSQFNVLM